MTTAAITAPTDAQPRYLADLCEERGLPPAVVYSAADASAAITAILNRTYDPGDYREPSSAPVPGDADFYGLDCEDDDVPF